MICHMVASVDGRSNPDKPVAASIHPRGTASSNPSPSSGESGANSVIAPTQEIVTTLSTGRIVPPPGSDQGRRSALSADGRMVWRREIKTEQPKKGCDRAFAGVAPAGKPPAASALS